MVNLKRTKEDILKSVFNTVHTKGLTATGLKELLEISGSSSGSFYNYFRSKKELGHALVDYEWLELKLNVLDFATQQTNNSIDSILLIIELLEAKQLESAECAGCLLGNFIVDLAEQDISFRNHLQDIFNRWQNEIENILKRDLSLLKPDVKPDLLAEAIVTSLEGAMLMGKLYRNPTKIRRGFDLVRHLVAQAVN